MSAESAGFHRETYIVYTSALVLITTAILVLGFRLRLKPSNVVVCCFFAEIALLIAPIIKLVGATYENIDFHIVTVVTLPTFNQLVHMLVIGGLLYFGRSYRPSNEHYTLHFKFIIALMIVMSMFVIPQVNLLISDNDSYQRLEGNLEIVIAALNGVALVNAIIYAFFQIAVVRTLPCGLRYAMNAEDIAIGTWYGLMAIIHSIFSLVWPLVRTCALRRPHQGSFCIIETLEIAAFVLIMGLPAPPILVNWTKQWITGRLMSRCIFLDRGVVSFGTPQGKAYDIA